MSHDVFTDGFYDRVKPRLHKRIGRELRLARRVLDLGCGSCDLVRDLSRTYHQQVTGVDISSESFPKGKQLQEGVRIRCIRKDATRLDFLKDGAIDAVVTMWALHEMKRPEAILAEAHRILRPGGEMLVVDFPQGSLAQELWNENYYTPGQVKRMLLKSGFAEVRAKLIAREQVMWITGHRPSLERLEQ
ncbi:MAG: class I SAM-dependent methyltransferase [Candidatus Eisenbacteria sp.]|nr:class I SAM-dependent methyltransferase [Candidatus Eisenbacteria bacterium]